MQEFMFMIRNNRLLQWLRIDFQYISSSCLKKWCLLAIHINLSSFNQNIENKKMQDAYYTETRLSDTGLVIIIVIDQLSDISAYLLSFLPEILCFIVRWVSKTVNYNFKNNSIILAVLFLFLTMPIFHNIYVRKTKQLR